MVKYTAVMWDWTLISHWSKIGSADGGNDNMNLFFLTTTEICMLLQTHDLNKATFLFFFSWDKIFNQKKSQTNLVIGKWNTNQCLLSLGNMGNTCPALPCSLGQC